MKVIRDIPYYTGPDAQGRRHLLDLYIPDGAQINPLLVFVHGGAWVGGSKDGYVNVGRAFAAAGYVTALINYRLSPRATHPAHVQDLARAFDWLVRYAADYGADPARIILSGHSAGGHMVALLTLDGQYLAAVGHAPEAIAAVVTYSGVFIIDDWILGWAMGAFPDDPAARAAASPQTYASGLTNTANLPPFLLLAAEHDYRELIDETEAMHSALKASGARVEMGILPNCDHFSEINAIDGAQDPTVARVIAWLDRILEN